MVMELILALLVPVDFLMLFALLLKDKLWVMMDVYYLSEAKFLGHLNIGEVGPVGVGKDAALILD